MAMDDPDFIKWCKKRNYNLEETFEDIFGGLFSILLFPLYLLMGEGYTTRQEKYYNEYRAEQIAKHKRQLRDYAQMSLQFQY